MTILLNFNRFEVNSVTGNRILQILVISYYAEAECIVLHVQCRLDSRKGWYCCLIVDNGKLLTITKTITKSILISGYVWFMSLFQSGNLVIYRNLNYVLFCASIVFPWRVFYLSASSQADAQDWIDIICWKIVSIQYFTPWDLVGDWEGSAPELVITIVCSYNSTGSDIVLIQLKC